MQGEASMLETLAGRLDWERVDQNIRVQIPVRPGALGVIYGSLIVAWLLIAALRNGIVLASPHAKGTEFTLQMIAMGIYIIGFLYFLWWLAWTFTGETVVFMDPKELKIQRRILGIDLVTRSFRTHQVDRMRYVPPSKKGANQFFYDPTSGTIQFRAQNATHSFGKGIVEGEANALIEQMLKIYAFPRSYFD
jgi:hypothetical protein